MTTPSETALSADLPKRIVVGQNGAYWRDYGDHYSMCPVSTDNDPVEVAAVYVRSRITEAEEWVRDAARSQPATEGLREAADRLLSLIDTANVPRTATITLARTGTLLEAIESLRAALAATEPAGDDR